LFAVLPPIPHCALLCSCRLRWIKSPAELVLMRASAAVAAQSLQRCVELSHPGVAEHTLAVQFEYGVKRAGAARLAYPVVAAGGADACTIHYSRNDKPVRALSPPKQQ
jgi:Xaa-Pro aminopeptidase